MVEALLGSWTLESSEHFEEFLTALDVSVAISKLALTSQPSMTISKTGEMWKITTAIPNKSTTVEFELGKECTETRLDGQQVNYIYTIEDKKLVQRQSGSEPRLVVTRWVEGDKLLARFEYKGVVCMRKYTKIPENTPGKD